MQHHRTFHRITSHRITSSSPQAHQAGMMKSRWGSNSTTAATSDANLGIGCLCVCATCQLPRHEGRLNALSFHAALLDCPFSFRIALGFWI